jgi:hypothetical protein
MRWKLHIGPVLAALVLGVLSLAPSAASAHPGHRHSQAAAQQIQPEAPTPAAHFVAPETAVAGAEVTAARTLPSIPPGDSDCDGCCCSNSPCTACHSALLAFSSVPVPSAISVMLAGGNASSRANLHDGRLRRPPKSFV